jgi:hypothetical protein
MRAIPSTVVPGHPDFPMLAKIREGILVQSGGIDSLRKKFPLLIREAIDFVLDPVRTARTRLSELDKIEKTFVGLKVEHYVRDMLDVPKGLRDLRIAGCDVDIKNTVQGTWMIPPETFVQEDPCLVIASDEMTHNCWLGLIVAREAYLNAGNRDQKRSVSAAAFCNILWLIEGAAYPESRWTGLNMGRIRELRKIRGGKRRAVAFFSENLRKPIHRVVIQSLLFNQHDYMKRLRTNGGARDELRKRGIALLSGIYDSALIVELGLPQLDHEETMAVAPNDAAEEALMRRKGVIA